jgi:hypothetical protein
LPGLPASAVSLSLAGLPVSAAALARLASAVPPPALLGPAVGASSKGPGPHAPGYPSPSAYGSFPSPSDSVEKPFVSMIAASEKYSALPKPKTHQGRSPRPTSKTKIKNKSTTPPEISPFTPCPALSLRHGARTLA